MVLSKEKIYKKKVVLHVGLSKTATTFLQLNIFPNIQNIFYMSTSLPECHNNPFKFGWDINRKDFSTGVKQIKIDIWEFIKYLKKDQILFSCEGLSGNWAFNYTNMGQSTIYLREIFGKAKILFVIRDQAEWLESIYKQVVRKQIESVFKKRELIKINDFFNYKGNTFHNKGKYMGVFNFNWLEFAHCYIKTFGKENVLILPYEMLKEDLTTFLKYFYEFTNYKEYYPARIEYLNKTPENSTIEENFLRRKYHNSIKNMKDSRLKNIIRKIINTTLSKGKIIRKFLDIFTSAELNLLGQKFSNYQREYIKKFYKKSNKELSELINVDLRKYGYY